jgi:hypothetical protein
MEVKMLIFDFWAHKPTEDELINLCGDCLPTPEQPRGTKDQEAHSIAALYTLRGKIDLARQYAESIVNPEERKWALDFIENPRVFDPVQGSIPLVR